jgi:murein tripeptide amidase MpaA
MYRTVAQIESAISILASWFPQYFTRLQLPHPSVQGRPVSALRMRAGGGEARRSVLVVGGTHARELMNPDAIIELAIDLLLSHANGTDIVYGGRRWTADEIRLILETLDLWLLPCLNPDGRDYVMTVDDLWRKNRRDNPGTECDGVDLNRNFDVVWGVTQGQTSCSPCAEVFCGPSAFSEPETLNVKEFLDSHRVDCFVDVHSYSELVLWPWGHASSQTTDPTKRFTTLPTGTCTPIGTPGYQEYIDPRDLQRFQTVGQRIVAAIKPVRGRTYTNEPGIGLYPTTGTQSDYVYSRHIANPQLSKIYGFTFETGPFVGDVRQSFHPTDPTWVKRDAKSGILALAQQCICAIELIGIQFLGRDTEVSVLRRTRDELLATTEAGRAWITLFERVQSRAVGVLLSDERLAADAAALLETTAKLLEDESATVGSDDVRRARSLFRELADRSVDRDVRSSLQAVDAELEHMTGRTSRDAVAELMRRAPRTGGHRHDA